MERWKEEKKSESTVLSEGGWGYKMGLDWIWRILVSKETTAQRNKVHRAEAVLTGSYSLHREGETTIQGAQRTDFGVGGDPMMKRRGNLRDTSAQTCYQAVDAVTLT
ncbi:uncharacterized protein ACO6RY_15388 [Pungitius sinensis]